MAIPDWGSVPSWLMKKMLGLEFVDMWDLLPESRGLESAEGGCCHSCRPSCRLVTNFPLWVKCYTTLGSYPVNVVPREDASLHGLFTDKHEGQ